MSGEVDNKNFEIPMIALNAAKSTCNKGCIVGQGRKI